MIAYQFISGALMMGCLVVAAFFVRFAQKTSDRLFAFFGAAFIVFAVERFILVIEDAQRAEKHALVYLTRLLGFLLILYAVFLKNRETRGE